jgi:hypothetical protein
MSRLDRVTCSELEWQAHSEGKPDKLSYLSGWEGWLAPALQITDWKNHYLYLLIRVERGKPPFLT